MLLQKTEVTKEQLRQQRQRSERFAGLTAEAIASAEHCLFSLLPYEERFRQAASWYNACAQAMLRGNYAPLDQWIQRQSYQAAEQLFELEDLLELLRICRRSAIDVDGWNEDIFSSVDEVINEGICAIRAKVPWKIPDDLNYLKVTTPEPQLDASESPDPEVSDRERRGYGRNRLALPIRVRGNSKKGAVEEITRTQNVSLNGLYFRTSEQYGESAALQVTYPYWTGQGAINREYPARVVRLDRLPDQSWGVAVEFLQDLGDKPGYSSSF